MKKNEKSYENGMLVVTTDTIPGKQFEVLGLVTANRSMSIFSKTEVYKAEMKLIDEASRMGADAIVGVRLSTSGSRSTTIYGTAVKFK